MTHEKSAINLSEYLSNISKSIQAEFGSGIWVKAEIRAISHKNNQHYYLELAENNNDKTIATCRAIIWRATAVNLIPKFERDAGVNFEKGLNVLIKVSAKFSEQYGFSLMIIDIDAAFTLGDISKRYNDLVKRLTDEEIIGKNKLLAHPFDISNVIVISPENAAGLGDFKHDADILEEHNLCHFAYHHAVFQGDNCISSITQAIRIALKKWVTEKQGQPPDLIIIIRGGGSSNDLAYLNHYDLAALLCNRSVPIWVGIGHERDNTILDAVAHRSFHTPSKLIAEIRNIIFTNAQNANDLFKRIHSTSMMQIVTCQNSIEALQQRTISVTKEAIYKAEKGVDNAIMTIRHASVNTLQQQTHFVDTHLNTMRRLALEQPDMARHANGGLIQSITHSAAKILIEQEQITNNQMNSIKRSSFLHINTASQDAEQLFKQNMAQSPKRILERGYAIVKGVQGVINSTSKGYAQPVDIHVKDGILKGFITAANQGEDHE